MWFSHGDSRSGLVVFGPALKLFVQGSMEPALSQARDALHLHGVTFGACGSMMTGHHESRVCTSRRQLRPSPPSRLSLSRTSWSFRRYFAGVPPSGVVRAPVGLVLTVSNVGDDDFRSGRLQCFASRRYRARFVVLPVRAAEPSPV